METKVTSENSPKPEDAGLEPEAILAKLVGMAGGMRLKIEK